MYTLLYTLSLHIRLRLCRRRTASVCRSPSSIPRSCSWWRRCTPPWTGRTSVCVAGTLSGSSRKMTPITILNGGWLITEVRKLLIDDQIRHFHFCNSYVLNVTGYLSKPNIKIVSLYIKQSKFLYIPTSVMKGFILRELLVPMSRRPLTSSLTKTVWIYTCATINIIWLMLNIDLAFDESMV